MNARPTDRKRMRHHGSADTEPKIGGLGRDRAGYDAGNGADISSNAPAPDTTPG